MIVCPSAIVTGPDERPFVPEGMVILSAIVSRFALITPYVSNHCESPFAVMVSLNSV